MIQQLAGLRGIGVQSATVLVREAFARGSPTAKRTGRTPDCPQLRTAAAGLEREQGIGKPAIDGSDRSW